MNIQWFPGHMAKALRLLKETIGIVDAIGYVLDSRAPFSCLNPEFEEIIERKPVLLILNKTDMADPKKVKLWEEHLKKDGSKVISLNSTNINERGKIVDAFRELTKPVSDKFKAKGVNKPIRIMIIGVPNSGKSTLINCISAKKSTVTGDKPGVTRGKQWVRLSEGIELMDTPGTLWPKFLDERIALNLSYIGSIKDEILDGEELAFCFLSDMIKMYPELLSARYAIENVDMPAADLLIEISKKRGYLLRGGEVDTERCAAAVLDDFRKGRLGKITLEEPNDRI